MRDDAIQALHVEHDVDVRGGPGPVDLRAGAADDH
jgi:hypothetical protein